MSEGSPVGVFDSGVGGLSVLRAIRAALPSEHLLYVADSGHAPYGEKPLDTIQARAASVVDFFLDQPVKAVVVACNTATGAAVDVLRARYTIPIVAIEPAIKPAAAATTSGVVGVLATTQTVSSAKVQQLVDRHSAGRQVLLQACPGLVERVEQGDLSSSATRSLVEAYVRPLVDQGADVLVLGCTHYPFLRPLIEDVAGFGVSVIDPAVAVARHLRRRLEAEGLLRPGPAPGTERFWTSAPPDVVGRVIAELWGPDADVLPLPERWTGGRLSDTFA